MSLSEARSEVIDLRTNRLDIVRVPLAPLLSQLGVLAGEISQLKEWKAFGVELGVPHEVLDQINKKHPKNAERAIHGVLKYYTENKKDASYNEVITALRNINELDLALKLSLKLCPPQTHEHDLKSSSSGPKELSVAKEDRVIKSLSYIQEEFAHLVTDLQNALEKEANFTQLKRYIKNYLGDTFRPQKDVTDIDNLFDTLQEHYCFINYDILEVITNKFALVLMAQILRDYKQELNEFLESTEVEYFKAAIVKVTTMELSGISPNQCHVILKLEGKWLEAKVKSLWILLKYIFRKEASLLTRLKVMEGSVIVQLAAPSSIMMSLIVLASRKYKEMAYLGILSIQVGNACLLASPNSIANGFTFESGLNMAISIHCNIELIRCLLELGANPNKSGDGIEAPLMAAAQFNNVEAMSLLVEYNANVHMFNIGHTSAIHCAACTGSNSCVKFLLEAGVSPDHHEHTTNITPLIIAASVNNEKAVSLLLERGANIDFQETNGYTALMQASIMGQALTTEALLNAGANPNLTASKNHQGVTALYLACRASYENIVKLLLNGKADPNIPLSDSKVTPLMIACHFATMLKDYEIVKLLLQAGAYVNAQAIENFGQITALYIAAYNNDTQLASLLLNANADVNFFDADSMTPMHFACFHGNDEMVKRFLKAGANPNLCSNDGLSALHIAIQNTNNASTIEALLKEGANPNAQTKSRRTAPLHLACDNGSNEDIVKLLLKAKADTDVLDSDGHTPLCVATCRGQTKIVELLLKAGANTELEDIHGWTPIFFAVAGGYLPIMKLLLEYGPAFEADKLKNLQNIAAQIGHTEAQQILFQAAETTTSEKKDSTSSKQALIVYKKNTQPYSSFLSTVTNSYSQYRKSTIEHMELKKKNAALIFEPSHSEQKS